LILIEGIIDTNPLTLTLSLKGRGEREEVRYFS
jgi:hypothetical protein